MGKPKIEVSGSREHFSVEQLRQITEPLEDSFDIELKQYFRASAETLFLLLLFMLGIYATGFFSKAGEDTYEELKKRVKKHVSKYDEKSTIAFEFKHGDIEVKARVESNDPEVIDKAMESGKQIIDAVDDQIRRKKLPKDTSWLYITFDKKASKWTIEGCIRGQPFKRFTYDPVTDEWT